MKKPDRREDDGVQGDLFRWAEARPQDNVVHFIERRERLPRWILARRPEIEAMLLQFDRRAGLEPPAPVIKLPALPGLRK